MNIETVNELIASLESAGELSIRETKVMALVISAKHCWRMPSSCARGPNEQA